MGSENLTLSQNYGTIRTSMMGTAPDADRQEAAPAHPPSVRRLWGKAMSPNNRQALEYLEVRGYYTTTYTRIVQPERIFAVTDYFRRYWVPLLKPGPAWLVVALRQRCFWNGQRDWCVVSRQFLAQESGIAIRTADNYLDLPLVNWFIAGRRARYSLTRDGAKQRDWTHYDVRLDEPLTPAHQAALAALAAEMAAGCQATGPLARALDIAQRILDLDPDDLRLRLDQPCSSDFSRSSHTIQQIIESAANPEPQTGGGPGEPLESHALTKVCDALYTRIVRPDKVQIASQYFRLKWLPLLGAARAWLILHLRAHCYLSTQDFQVRDIANVAGLTELSAALGVSISTVKTCLSEPPAASFLIHLATRRPAAGQVAMSFKVEMIDPLTPADQARRDGQAVLPDGEDQQPDFAGSLSGQQPDSAAGLPAQKTESALAPGQQPDFAASLSDQQPDSAVIDSPANSQILQDTKVPTITFDPTNTQQQQVLIPPNRETQPLAAAAGPVVAILTSLKIHEPVRSRILALNPPATVVLAWTLEAASSERIENRVGFIVSMLLAGFRPPPDLEQLAGLPVSDWLVLAQAARDTRATGRAQLPPRLVLHFEALYTRLGRLDPARWPILLPLSPQALAVEEEEEPAQADRTVPLSASEGASDKASTSWALALADLRTQMDPSTFDAWLRGAQLIRVEGNRWTVAVRSQTAAGWLEHRLLAVVERTLQRVAGERIEVTFEAGPGA